MPISKLRKKKVNYYGAKRNEVACFGLEIARYGRYMDEIIKTGDCKEFKDLLNEIKSYDGFLGIYTPQTSDDIFDSFDNNDPYCLVLFDTPEHRNKAYNDINNLDNLPKDMSDDDIIKNIKVLLVMKVVLVKKEYIGK